MKLNEVRKSLEAKYQPDELLAEMTEIEAAEAVSAMLRRVVDAYFADGTVQEEMTVLREAQDFIAKVGG